MNRKCHSLMPLFRGVRLCPEDNTLRISYAKVFLKTRFVQSDLSSPVCFFPLIWFYFIERRGLKRTASFLDFKHILYPSAAIKLNFNSRIERRYCVIKMSHLIGSCPFSYFFIMAEL